MAFRSLITVLAILTGIAQIGYAQSGFPTGSDTTCVNGLTFFQKTFGSDKEDFISAIVTTSDSGYVLGGFTRSTGLGGADALLLKVNKRGQLIWAKVLGGSSDDVIHMVRKTSDNGFIVSGQTKSFGNSAGDAWLVKLDASGTVIWSRRYGTGSAEGSIAFDVIQLSDGGYAFAGGERFAAGLADGMITRTDALGNTIWSQKYQSGSTDYFQGLVEDGDFILAVGVYYGFSFYEGSLVKVNKADGTLNWSKGYDGDNRSTWFGKIQKTTAGYQVQSLLTDNFFDLNQQMAVWNIDVNGNLINARKLSIPGIKTNSAGWLPQADGGFIASNNDVNGNDGVILTKVGANGQLVWVHRFDRVGVQFLATLTQTPEGGIAGAGISNLASPSATGYSDSSEVFMARVDRLGQGGNCSGTNATGITAVPVATSQFNDYVTGVQSINWNPSSITISVNAKGLTTTTFCSVCVVPSLPVVIDPVCDKDWLSYQKSFGGDKEEYALAIVSLPDSGSVVAGFTKTLGNGGSDGMLVKVSRSGQLIWARAVGGAQDDVFYQMRRTSDNGFIACGQTKSFGNTQGSAWLVKFDASGTLQWARQYNDGSANGSIAFDVVQLSDGGYAIAGGWNFAPSTADGMLIRTDSQGNSLWSRKYGRASTDYLQGLLEDGEEIVAVGLHIQSSFYDGHILKVNKSDGQLSWSKGHDGDNRSTWFGKLAKTNGGYQVVGLLTDNYADQNQQQAVWNLDANGNLVNARKIVIPGIKTNSAGWISQPDGGFIASNGDMNGQQDVFLAKVSSTGGLTWAKKAGQPGIQLLTTLAINTEGGISGTGQFNNFPALADSAQVYLARFDSLGNADSCTTLATGISVSSVSSSNSVNPVSDLGVISWNTTAITITSVNPSFGTATHCYSCVRKPTGTSRVAGAVAFSGTYQMRVFPNPVNGTLIQVAIEGDREDKAIISILDIYGNVVYVSNEKEIRTGSNIFTLNPPVRLQSMSSYFILVRFSQHIQTQTIFVLHN